jgi:hypothetical protein
MSCFSFLLVTCLPCLLASCLDVSFLSLMWVLHSGNFLVILGYPGGSPVLLLIMLYQYGLLLLVAGVF